MRLRIRRLTPALWPALAELFGARGACGGCWCMYWRIGAAYRRRPAAHNRRDFRRVVGQGPAPGLLAFDGDEPVGWCQLTPRAALPWLDGRWPGARGSRDTWALSCLYVKVGWRRRGVSEQLIRAAIAVARRARATALEAYPLDGARSPSASGTGYVSSFARAGFRVVARRSAARPVMRLALR